MHLMVLGEMIVQGSVSPDEYIVFKPTLKEGFASIIERKLGNKDRMMVYGDNPDERVQIIPVEKPLQQRYCLSNEQNFTTSAMGSEDRRILLQPEKTLVPDGCGMGGGWFNQRIIYRTGQT